jgi:hypothetical protein
MDGLFIFLALVIAMLSVAGLDTAMGRPTIGRWKGALGVAVFFLVFFIMAFGFQSLGLISSPG